MKTAMPILALLMIAGCASIGGDRPTRILCPATPAATQQAATALVRAGYSITFMDSTTGTIQAEKITGAGGMATGGKWQVAVSRSADTMMVRVTSISSVYNGTTAVMTWSEDNARGETRKDLLSILDPLRAVCSPSGN